MNRFNILTAFERLSTRSLRAPLALLLTVWLSGCYFLAADNDIKRDGTHPWWCQGGTVSLSDGECYYQSLYADYAVVFANQYWQLSDFQTAGAVLDSNVATAHPQVGQAYVLASATSFDGMSPNVIFYSGNSPTSRPIAVGWAIDDDLSGNPPAGFVGDSDAWSLVNGKYWLPMWVIRGYENHPDMFALGHPCVDLGTSLGTLSATADTCYTASHTVDLEILVTNDDGIMAEGIDHLVEGLQTVSGITFTIVAPATGQSGSGGSTTPGLDLSFGSAGSTLSGEMGTAVNGFPADAVLYALNLLRLSPDVTMSGINDGQNLADVGHTASGTIGAARRSVTRGFPSMALSQGGNATPNDWDDGVAASLALLEQWRLGEAGQPHMVLPNLNIPSCEAGGSGSGINGTLNPIDVGLNLDAGGGPFEYLFGTQDCASTETVFVDDFHAFMHGWITVGDMGRVQPPNYP